jgi:hypothetical protein
MFAVVLRVAGIETESGQDDGAHMRLLILDQCRKCVQSKLSNLFIAWRVESQ